MLASGALTDVDTTYPNLTPGLYEFRVKSMAQKINDPKTYEWIAVELELVSSTGTDEKGNPISVGYIVRDMISLTPSEKVIQEHGEEAAKQRVMVGIAKFLDAVEKDRVWDETFQSYIGKTLFAKTKITKENEEKGYGPQTAVASYIKKAN